MSNKFWRDASSLILIFRNSSKATINTPFDYSLLMLKRSGKSKFMPNAYVFPGGVTEQGDFDKNWLDLIGSCSTAAAERSTNDLILTGVPRPMLVQDQGKNVNGLDNNLAFRVGAIRETFEEAGILLHRPCDNGKTGHQFDDANFAEWRERVRKDPSEFYAMCKSLSICPDVWSL